MQASLRFKDIETALFIDFFTEICIKSTLFEGALLTGSLVKKATFDCVNDIDIVFSVKEKNILLAQDFLESLKAVLITNIDYCLINIDEPETRRVRAEKFGLIWTSFFLSKKLFGTVDLSLFKTGQESFELFQNNKIQSTSYFEINNIFKMTDVFPVVYGYFSLHLAKKFLSVYSYRKSKLKPLYFDKEELLACFPKDTQIESIIIRDFLVFYQQGELIEMTPTNTIKLGKLAYLIQDLYLSFDHG